MITHLPQAACWTVVQPLAGPLTVEELAVRLGGSAEDLVYEEDEDLDPADYEAFFQFSRDGDAWVVFEDNGYQGSLTEVVQRLSVGAKVTSLFWNVNAVAHLAHAVDGAVLVELDPLFPDVRAGSQPHLLDAELSGLGGDDWKVSAITAVERITGISLDWPDEGPWMALEEVPD